VHTSVVFIGNPDRPGWITMQVNEKGRKCVEALFPQANIAWRDAGDIMPADWYGFQINLPDVLATMETGLPLTKDANLDEASNAT
jgi:phage tail protein X